MPRLPALAAIFAVCLALGAVLAGPVVAEDLLTGVPADVAAAEMAALDVAEEASADAAEKAPVVPVDPGPGVVWVVTLDDEIINRGTRDYYIGPWSRPPRIPRCGRSCWCSTRRVDRYRARVRWSRRCSSPSFPSSST